MNLCIYEDEYVADSYPLTLTRPFFELRCGINTLRKKILSHVTGEQIIYFVQKHLEGFVRERYSDSPVNTLPAVDTLFINGRVLFNGFYTDILDTTTQSLYVQDDVVLAAFIRADAIRAVNSESAKGSINFGAVRYQKTHQVEWKTLRYPWNFISAMPAEIESDLQRPHSFQPLNGDNWPGVHVDRPSQVFLRENVTVKSGAILDAEQGPIVLDKNVVVGHNAVVVGPCYLGPATKISSGAKLTGKTSFGPVCKVGGEVGETIIQGYSNKKHEGFLGGAFLGKWVNLGANTSNSDLKNNYSTVTVPLHGTPIDTGLQFAGCIIGDHTKTAIGTLINTGAVIGVGCNIFGSGFPEKYIPSFTWGGVDSRQEYRFEKMIDTAQIVMARRDVPMSAIYQSMLRDVFAMTAGEREK